MIDRLLVQLKDSKRIEEELKYLKEHYNYTIATKEDNPKEIVLLTYANKVLLYTKQSYSYVIWDTSICLQSFKDIPQLHILQSLGLSDKELQEYFPWG